MKIEHVIITPEQAAQMLSKNLNNRTLRKKVVDRYAKDMQNGEWVLNGETLKFDDSGNVVDGQHRLAGVAQQRNDVEFLVVRNVSKDAKFTIDTGVSRTSADVLSIAGIPNSTRMGAVAKRVMMYNVNPKRTDMFSARATMYNITNKQLVEFVHINMDYIDSLVDDAVNLNNSYRLIGMQQYAVIIHMYVHEGWDQETIVDILSRMAKGANLAETDPLFMLKKKIQDWSWSNRAINGLTARNTFTIAINAVLSNQYIRSIKASDKSLVLPVIPKK